MCLSWKVRFYECRRHVNADDYHSVEIDPLQPCDYRQNNPNTEGPCPFLLTMSYADPKRFCPECLIATASTSGENPRRQIRPRDEVVYDQTVPLTDNDDEYCDQVLLSARNFAERWWLDSFTSFNDYRDFIIEGPLSLRDLGFLILVDATLYDRIIDRLNEGDHVSEKEVLTYASIHFACTKAILGFWTFLYHSHRPTFDRYMPHRSRTPSEEVVKTRLDRILRDVNVKELKRDDDDTCYICLQSFGDETIPDLPPQPHSHPESLPESAPTGPHLHRTDGQEFPPSNGNHRETQVVKLPCGHSFDRDCLIQWLGCWNGEDEKFRLCTQCQGHFDLFSRQRSGYINAYRHSPGRVDQTSYNPRALHNPSPRWLIEIANIFQFY